MFCSKCGKELNPEDKFCNNCGEKVEEKEEVKNGEKVKKGNDKTVIFVIAVAGIIAICILLGVLIIKKSGSTETGGSETGKID